MSILVIVMPSSRIVMANCMWVNLTHNIKDNGNQPLIIATWLKWTYHKKFMTHCNICATKGPKISVVLKSAYESQRIHYIKHLFKAVECLWSGLGLRQVGKKVFNFFLAKTWKIQPQNCYYPGRILHWLTSTSFSPASNKQLWGHWNTLGKGEIFTSHKPQPNLKHLSRLPFNLLRNWNRWPNYVKLCQTVARSSTD